MKINITVRNIYGKELYYCENEAVCALVGKKTLDVRDMKNLRTLGHEINMSREPLIVDGIRVG